MLERKEIDIGLADLSLTFPRIKVNIKIEKKSKKSIIITFNLSSDLF